MLLAVHHIVIDFWSLALILNELSVLYPAEKAGVTAALPPLDLQYTDYVRWQTEMLAGPEGERLWAYWRKQLAGQLPVLNLPTDRPRPPMQTYRGASHDFNLNDELSWLLKALAKANGVTLYMVLLAAFQVMLHYHTGQEDLLVASPWSAGVAPSLRGSSGSSPILLSCERIFPEIQLSRRFLARCARPCWPRSSIRITRPCCWSNDSGRPGISAARRCAR